MSPAFEPLLGHRSPDATLAYRAGRPIAAGRFLADVARVASQLPDCRHVLNVCADRYRFAVGLAACLITDRVSLLPSTHTPQVIEQLKDFAPDTHCLTDDAACSLDLPRHLFPPLTEDVAGGWCVPRFPTSQLAAIVFTSGSTGEPLPFRKTWGKLSRCVRDGASRLGMADERSHAIIGTVPAQHMYGFESTVLLAMLTGGAFTAERPFYPADICAQIAALPRPRTLVSTPVHLRALLGSEPEPPAVDLIVSATAALPVELARTAETKFDAPLLEIYGSTETGQIATRRPSEALAWRLWPDVRLCAERDTVYAQGGHVEQRTALCDVLELVGDSEFFLLGRKADLVNIAGKRSSFAYLDAQLNGIPGVTDGAFFMPDRMTDAPGTARLAALCAAPTLNAAAVEEQLRRRIDPVFMPRPLLLVDRLPRNATGKLPQHALQRVLEEQRAARGAARHSTLRVPAEHPAFTGHFPGAPIFPGALLLDEVLRSIAGSRSLDLTQWRLDSAKFMAPVRPGTELRVEHDAPDLNTVRFIVRHESTTVAAGRLSHGS